jgi:hypothetical protein
VPLQEPEDQVFVHGPEGDQTRFLEMLFHVAEGVLPLRGSSK